nr:MAG TPA: hypothetical protein [Caudoviricetes sp.]
MVFHIQFVSSAPTTASVYKILHNYSTYNECTNIVYSQWRAKF